jgi:hypothetical protein
VSDIEKMRRERPRAVDGCQDDIYFVSHRSCTNRSCSSRLKTRQTRMFWFFQSFRTRPRPCS